MAHKLSRTGVVIQSTIIILTLLTPGLAHAASQGPIQSIPGWLQAALNSLETALVKTLQDTARVGGVLLWGILKVCGMVGLFGNDFSALFGTVITEALNAVITGQVHDLIRGSLMVSLGLFGLSLLARPFWPGFKLVSFQRAAIWGIVIQAYLLNAPAIYTELETWRVGLSEQVAGAVSTGAIPGCSGNVVEVPQESFQTGFISNYINIFLKSVVLMTLVEVVIRLISIAAGSPLEGCLTAVALPAMANP